MNYLDDFSQKEQQKMYLICWTKARFRRESKDYILGFLHAKFPDLSCKAFFLRVAGIMIRFTFEEYCGICLHGWKDRTHEESFLYFQDLLSADFNNPEQGDQVTQQGYLTAVLRSPE